MNYRKKAMLMAGALLCLNLSIYSQSISLKNEQCSSKKKQLLNYKPRVGILLCT